jgi:hypothetical protein
MGFFFFDESIHRDAGFFKMVLQGGTKTGRAGQVWRDV